MLHHHVSCYRSMLRTLCFTFVHHSCPFVRYIRALRSLSFNTKCKPRTIHSRNIHQLGQSSNTSYFNIQGNFFDINLIFEIVLDQTTRLQCHFAMLFFSASLLFSVTFSNKSSDQDIKTK